MMYSQQFQWGQSTRMRPKDPARDGHQEGGRSSAHLRRYQATQKQIRNNVTTEKHGGLSSILLVLSSTLC
jgi:hypothetical protein